MTDAMMVETTKKRNCGIEKLIHKEGMELDKEK